ncbi:RtcB family protein [Candidatus Falkowbacteria bacterium]|nr:RtcB family protein [Candidatus Falkowbacteria bacterium]
MAIKLNKINDYLFEIPKYDSMRVPARFYANEKLLSKVKEDKSLWQLQNVATLPGIQRYALAMPDMHEGYGFPIGGVAAFDLENGIISPGGVGYDINCGVRLLASSMMKDEVRPSLVSFMNQLQRDIPSGVGSGGALTISIAELNKALKEGIKWAVQNNYASEEDMEHCEANGRIECADADLVSDLAKKRGHDQLGTLGSGNHFLETQYVEGIFDDEIAKTFGLFKNQVVIMIHSGSRGLGHQVCTDYVRLFNKNLDKFGFKLPDRELACAPIKSKEGQDYLKAMSAAANFAWANRQLMTHAVCGVWNNVLKRDKKELRLVYDVAHNIAKIEEHEIGGIMKKVCVHRKGATRAFPPEHVETPKAYKKVGQPVIIPGSMGTSSYILAGTKEAMRETFGSVCHGAGRVMSRGAAARAVFAKNVSLKQQLENQGIIIRCRSSRGLAEEAPLAYKDVDEVVEIVAGAGLAKKVAKLRPLGVVKGE